MKEFFLSKELLEKYAAEDGVQEYTVTIAKKFAPISNELFEILYELEDLPIDLYLRFGTTLLRFIPKSTSLALYLDEMRSAMERPEAEARVLIRKSDKTKFLDAISDLRERKLEALLKKNPNINRKVVGVFNRINDISSELIAGGLDSKCIARARSVVTNMVASAIDSKEALQTISKLIEFDPKLYSHGAAVSMVSVAIAQGSNLSFSKEDLRTLAESALFHNIGLTLVRKDLLFKKDPLSSAEEVAIQSHTVFGRQHLVDEKVLGLKISDSSIRVAYEHHENFDGSGFPEGKKGEEIHIHSRIVALADQYMELLSPTTKRSVHNHTETLKVLIADRKKYDPDLFNSFVKSIVGAIKDEADPTKGKILLSDSGRLRQVG